MPRLTRRHVLRSASALIALPALDSLGFRRFAAAASAAVARPKRLVFLGFGWGVTAETWYPNAAQTGPDYTLPEGLVPLARHKADFTIAQGLHHRHSGEGHSGSTFWLTGADKYAKRGTISNSISADQVAAAQFGMHTRFASLQLNGAFGQHGDGHGGGLSLAWDVNGKPIGGYKTPVETFHRLFSGDDVPLERQQALLARRRSVLDTVLEPARDLDRRLGTVDREKLAEYFESIRDIEIRLAKEEKWLDVPRPKAPLAEPAAGLEGREEIRLMYDLIVAALQADSTRVVTYRQPVKSLLASLKIAVNDHAMSHYHLHPGTSHREASQARDIAQSELLAGLLDRLKDVAEPDGSRLFDHTTLVYGSNLSTEHTLLNCPTLIAGRGAGIKLGHNLVFPKNTPLCNAWLTILKGSGVEVEKHGDSTGVLDDLVA